MWKEANIVLIPDEGQDKRDKKLQNNFITDDYKLSPTIIEERLKLILQKCVHEIT